VASRRPTGGALERRTITLREETGAKSEYWQLERTRATLRTDRYFEAIFHPEAFLIDPLAYVRALADAAAAAGVRLFEGTRARAWAREKGQYQITTDLGSVTAKDVLFCTSGYDRELFRPLTRAVIPVATYVAVTEPLGERARQAIITRSGVSDTRRAGDYYRLIPEERLLWGGHITTRRSEPPRLAR
jgi:gamma-glutamylputrescine oxidase